MAALSFKKMEDLFFRYKTWVVSNPQGAAEMEAVVKWGSYIIAGRLKNSSLLCEVVYSGSRLFEMFNDFLVKGILPELTSKQGEKLKVLLTVLEYLEVLIEVSAVQLWGEVGRWAVITFIQIIKCIGRFLLVLKYKSGVVSSPPIKPIDRKAVIKSKKEMQYGLPNNSPEVIRLPQSGRFMRTLAGAPPSHQRTFTPPKPPNNNENEPSSVLVVSQKHLIAEVIHILRPLSHLSSLYVFGKQSWTPWLLSLGLDLASLKLYDDTKLTKLEKAEIIHRRIGLVYYLVRSPAFHSVTHKRIERFLSSVGNRIPLARTVCQPILEYIPEWQKIYAYTWS
ncbi:peroxisomal membrane protein PEX16 [Palaemon carinicauda]|uniref:peroxisomal membrane protein PEX16 n=1 Tax=Palaemon carinicauda TaxID=392227 RepID=UPI0035B65E23